MTANFTQAQAESLQAIDTVSSRRPVEFVRVEAARLADAKRAFTTRRVPLGVAAGLVAEGVTPRAGDLVLARVTRLGQHKTLQAVSGRRQNLFVGDEIIAVFGHRYAPDQFEAVVPESLGPCQLAAGGGVIATVRHGHMRMGRPTEVLPLGLLTDAQGAVINIRRYRLSDKSACVAPPACVIAVLGTSMNAGKSTVAAHLIRGLRRTGLKVGAAKVTGTGAGADTFLFVDAGADPVLDFVDFGFASTYRLAPNEVEHIFIQTLRHLDDARVDVVVIEVADGLFQGETAALVQQSAFRARVDGIVFAAADSMGAAGGVEWLERRGLPVLALGGMLTTAPLAAREASQATRLPILSSEELASESHARALLAELDLRRLPTESRA
jgi:hypothetical protein